MPIPRVFVSGLSCRACRVSVARSVSTTPSQCPTLRASWTSSQRSISSTAAQKVDKNDPTNIEPEFSFLNEQNGAPKPAATTSTTLPPEPTLDTTTTTSTTAPPTPSPLPWYLQNRPLPTPHLASPLPTLPPKPPPLLPPLLDYLSNTAGLDDLTLLDLRHLDPPPALGPKLIMLVCTARSEKHLHVSADRFCRYLRREHHLRANAAGLLGRNELKIKIRRKAKRMKMLANVGATEEGNIDDGIRTGWICCTLEKIEAHPDDVEVPGDDVEGFVGFRDVRPGVNLVVQMFTEEKRAETDLETLWGGVLRSGERRDRVAEERLRELEESFQEEEMVEEGEEEGFGDEVERQLQTPRSQRRGEREMKKATTTVPPTETPTPTPTSRSTPQFAQTRPSLGDDFPPASNPGQFQQMRRMHSVGLRM
ncbi:hypothetical protein CC80DRAFT_525989 [Byssothecium circinans]|uniref:ATPase synthesis protein 25 n=1 Tax=Byssothecium circinans TaxID=147558 RepID=A0A6A5TTU0_9PLEO|nr:hypothetical protein CC80DRAFT_525989 [Byssothecium circinans]